MKVKFVPQNVEFEIKPGQSVMHVAQDNGMYIKSVCKGVPSCAECRVRVVDGDYNVLPPGSEELSLIGTGHFIDHRRLSCQLKCFGDITVDMSEQIAKESGLMGGRKSKSRTQKDDRVEDVHAIRLNDSEGGARREKTGDRSGSERGDKKNKPPKNPLKIGESKTPVSIDGGVSAPVVKTSDIPADVAAVPFPVEEAGAPSQGKPRAPRDGRDQRGPREGRGGGGSGSGSGGDRQQGRDSRGSKQAGSGGGQNQGKQKQQNRGPSAGSGAGAAQGPGQQNSAQAKSDRPKHHVMGEAGGDRESREALPRAEAIPKPQPISHSQPTKSVEARDSETGDSSTDGEAGKGPRRKRRRGGRGSRGGGGAGQASGGGSGGGPNSGGGSGGSPGGPRAQGGPGSGSGAGPKSSSAPQGKPTPKPGGRGPSGSTGSGSGGAGSGTSAPGKPS